MFITRVVVCDGVILDWTGVVKTLQTSHSMMHQRKKTFIMCLQYEAVVREGPLLLSEVENMTGTN